MLLSLPLLALLASPALAQLGRLRGTIPGSLHQCEATSMFFFDSGATRPLSVLFLPSANVPASLRTGTTTLSEALQYSPLLALSGIQTADANEYPFELQVAAGDVFEVFAFLPDGSGKALSLTRTVTTALPGATNCLTNIPTTIPGVSPAGATTAAPAASTTAAAQPSTTSAAVVPLSTLTATRRATTTTADAITPITLSSTGTSSTAAAAQTSVATGAGSRAYVGAVGAVVLGAVAMVA